jgi:hypothetical protein
MKNLIEQLALTADTMRIAGARNFNAIEKAAYDSLSGLCAKLEGAEDSFVSPNGVIPHITTQGYDLTLIVRGTDWERETGNIRFVILAEENLDNSALGEFALVDLKENKVKLVTIEGAQVAIKGSVDLALWVAEMEA